MESNRIERDYFRWLYGIVCSEKGESYRKLLQYLQDVEFVPIVPMDENRVGDGLDLRNRFCREKRVSYKDMAECLGDRPCSVLEMMIALACRCEESIMHDPDYGDRTPYWFWCMIDSLGVSDMSDNNFRPIELGHIMYIFLNRMYERNGEGGLFTIHDNSKDMRKTDIWYQMNYYLNEIVPI